jgi:hypothetical protein
MASDALALQFRTKDGRAGIVLANLRDPESCQWSDGRTEILNFAALF